MLRKLFTNIFLGINALSLLLLWGCCAITWFPPYACPRLAVCCLAFPIILALNIVFVPIWMALRPRLIPIPVVGILLCLGFVLDYCPLNSQGQEDSDGEGVLTVLSWNMMNLSHDSIKEKMESFLTYLDSANADIVCLQECGRGNKADTLKAHMTDAGYNWAESKGRTIYSRFPILSEDTLWAETALSNGFNVYTLLAGEGDTLVVMNVHLESNYLTVEDKYDGKAALLSGNEDDLKEKGGNIMAKLTDSQRIRGAQVDTMILALDGRFANASTIVCGDFNDTPISYAYQQVKRRMQNAYRNKGQGVGVSYNEQYFYFRIDHIFHTDDWETLSARVDDTYLASDHYPLIVKLRRR